MPPITAWPTNHPVPSIADGKSLKAQGLVDCPFAPDFTAPESGSQRGTDFSARKTEVPVRSDCPTGVKQRWVGNNFKLTMLASR